MTVVGRALDDPALVLLVTGSTDLTQLDRIIDRRRAAVADVEASGRRAVALRLDVTAR